MIEKIKKILYTNKRLGGIMKKEVTKKLEGSAWEAKIEEAYKKASKNFKVDGFRQGHVPKEVFMKKYKEETLWMDAAEDYVDEAYHEVMNENKDLEIVAQPKVDIKSIDKNGVEFVFTLVTKPEVKLGKYKNLGVKKEEVTVTKEEVEKSVEEMRNHYAEYVVKTDAIKEGDIAVIDFEGFKDNVPFEGGKAENYSLTIGSHTFIPGFEESLIGHSEGEEIDVNVTFPEDYHVEELKGAPVVFKVKINIVKEKKIPELDEEFFADLGMEGINSKETLEKQLEENIKARKEFDNENKYIDELLDKAVETIEVEVPEEMIYDETSRMIERYSNQLMGQGIKIEDFYKMTKSNEEELREKMHDEALKIVKQRLLLEEVIKTEKLEVSDEEVEHEAEHLAGHYNITKDEFIEQYGLESVKFDCLIKKAIEVLKQND